MRIIWDAPITTDDGTVLRADVFLPEKQGKYPVIITLGPYAKGLSFQSGYKGSWDWMIAAYPEIAEGTTAKYANWELVDPEKWTPDGYVCLRVDGRGAGRSQGKLDLFSPRETKDFYDCIEWAGVQPWSSGKVGILGISIRGKDYENGLPDAKTKDDLFPMNGVGPFTHADPQDRPATIFGGKYRLHFEAGKEP